MSEAGPEASLRLAAFDFDGTITRRDTLLGFLIHAGGAGRTAAAAARNSVDLAKVLADDSTRDTAKERVVGAALRGLTAAQLDERGETYASRLPTRFRPDVVERIEWHRAEGHELVMVSASLVYYLRPVARSLGFAEVIGVELEIGDDGRTTGLLARPNVRGEEKATRLRDWLGDRPVAEMWGYGNSSGDEALLAMADHPVWIGKRAG